MLQTQTGLERFIENPSLIAHNKTMGLLCNPASVDCNIIHARHLIQQILPGQLTALFSPQHGFYAEKQDNMIESDHITDPDLQIPVFSLYSDTRMPTKEMFDLFDILLVDLQDVGTRVYTFIYTVSYCLEAAKAYGKKVIILDRPNPINGISIEGNLLKSDCASFVGRYSIPMRHGLTIGELMLLFNDHYKIGCDLDVISMKNWKRSMYFQDTGLPWIAPSPNLPTPTSAMVYPGQVIWEGTNVSEGRGTTQPFELFGAPFLNVNKILSSLEDADVSGAVLRPVFFEPTANKWAGKQCRGFQIHIKNPDKFTPYKLSLTLLQMIYHYNKDKFEWKPPPYEYEFERMPIDLILGDKEIRLKLEQNKDIDHMEKSWKHDIEEFKSLKQKFHLYQ